MAKKHSNNTNSGIDPRLINSQLSNEREKLIQQGKDNNFIIRFMNGMFLVKDETSQEPPVAFVANRSVVSAYTLPVLNYMEKLRAK